MRIIGREQAQALVTPQVAIAAMRDAFASLHRGQVVAPEEFSMSHPVSGDIHIKGAHLHGSDWMVAKVASAGFAVPGNHGCLLGINSRTGAIEVLVDDEGFLTEIRTAAAVALSVDLLALPTASRLCLIGSGVQAGYQLDAVRTVRSFDDICVYSRNPERAAEFAHQHDVRCVSSLAEATADADVILIATNSRGPVMTSLDHVKPGTHISASGADMVGKIEIAPEVASQVDVLAVDDCALAERFGVLQNVPPRSCATLGELLAGTAGRTNDQQITLAGLSGLGVQDAAIFAALLHQLCE
jgi:ornithine cyclodeaminase